MKFLIVVDMQNDFITGSLGTKEAEAILPKVLEKIRTYRPEQIFVTQDTHPDNYLETNEGRHLPVAHCIAGSQGHALNPLVAEALEGVLVRADLKPGDAIITEGILQLSEGAAVTLLEGPDGTGTTPSVATN